MREHCLELVDGKEATRTGNIGEISELDTGK
jgi:hypothetical protein